MSRITDEQIMGLWHANSGCEYPQEYQMKAIRAVADAAIAADRSFRGEPVAWHWYERGHEWNGYEGRERVNLDKPVGYHVLSRTPLYYSPTIPEGYVIVPITPTFKMLKAISTGRILKAEESWADTLDASKKG